MSIDQQTARLVGGQPLREALQVAALDGARVLAGEAGLERVVQRLNVMEVPDILPWVKPHELLLTTAYPLRDEPEALVDLVTELDARGLAGLGIKVGRYLDALPPAMLDRADELDFPIIQLPDQVSFDEIFNQVLPNILNQQAALLARSDEVHRTFLQIVLTGGGLDEIADQLAVLVGNPAAIAAADGRIVAAADPDGPVDVGALAELLADPVVDGDVGLVVPVPAGGRVLGRVATRASVRPLRHDDRLALENAATVAALALTKANELAAVESRYQTNFLHDLLAGRVSRRGDAVGRGRTFGWDLDRELTLLVVRPAEPLPEDGRQAPLTSTIQQAVRAVDPAAAVVELSAEVVVLTGPTDRRGAADLVAAANGGDVTIGLSRPIDGPLDVATAYRQATQAVEIGRGIEDLGRVVSFDDLGAYRLLSLVPDHGELRAFVRETLGELAGDDERAADLRHTLDVLLATNTNVAEAARQLHFHYNTLRYRIGKLEGIVGDFMDDARRRLDLQVALLILRMAEVWE